MLSKCSLSIAVCALLFRGPFAPMRAQDANHDVVETRSDIRTVVDRLAKKSGEFKDAFDDAVSHSMIDGTRLEANTKHRADDLHDATKRLADVFHDKRDKDNPAVRAQGRQGHRGRQRA
jgi:hypothetical protein